MKNARPDVQVACCNLIFDGSAYLLVAERAGTDSGPLSFPGGKLEAGESLVEAAKREAEEEVGLKVRPTGLVGVFHCKATRDGRSIVDFVFHSEVMARVGDGSLKTVSLTREQVEDLNRRGQIRGEHIPAAISAFEDGRTADATWFTEIGYTPDGATLSSVI